MVEETTESRWFKIIVFIIAGVIAVFAFVNILYYNRLRRGDTITQGEATAMFWVNIVLFVVAIIIFLYSIYRLTFTQEVRTEHGRTVAEYFTSTQGGIVGPPASGIPTGVAGPGVGVAPGVVSPGAYVPRTTFPPASTGVPSVFARQ